MWTLHHFFEANLDHFLGNLWYIHIYAHDLCWSCYKNRKLFKVIVPNLCQHWDLKKTQTIDSIGLNPHSKTQTIDPPVKHQKIPVAVGQNQLPRPTSGTSGTSGHRPSEILPSLPSWPWTPRTLLRDDRVRRGATRCGPGAFLSWSSLSDDFYMVLVMSGYVSGVIMNHIGVDLLTVSIWGQNSIISYTTNKHAGFMPGYKQQKQKYIHYRNSGI